MINFINQPTKKLPTFSFLKIGDAFIKNGNLHIVIEEVINHDDYGFNAVMLAKNEVKLKWLNEDEEVEPVDVNIEIKYKGE